MVGARNSILASGNAFPAGVTFLPITVRSHFAGLNQQCDAYAVSFALFVSVRGFQGIDMTGWQRKYIVERGSPVKKSLFSPLLLFSLVSLVYGEQSPHCFSCFFLSQNQY